MIDLIARGEGVFTLLRDGRMFDLTYTAAAQRKWVEVAAPFVPVKLTLRADNSTFAVDDAGDIWQRLPDRREYQDGQTTVTAEWRLIARAPA